MLESRVLILVAATEEGVSVPSFWQHPHQKSPFSRNSGGGCSGTSAMETRTPEVAMSRFTAELGVQTSAVPRQRVLARRNIWDRNVNPNSAFDGWRLEILACDLPLCLGHRFAIDATIASSSRLHSRCRGDVLAFPEAVSEGGLMPRFRWWNPLGCETQRPQS